MKWRGKSNRLDGSVDLGLLPRIPKGLQVLVARMGDLVILSFATMEEREWKPPCWSEVEDNYLYPSQISSRWGRLTLESPASRGWSLWCHPESPACKDRNLRLLGANTQSLRPVSLETLDRLQRLAPLGWKTSLGGRILWLESPTQNQSLWAFQAGVPDYEGRSLRPENLKQQDFCRVLSNKLQRGKKCI
jgi:hypothetical protein